MRNNLIFNSLLSGVYLSYIYDYDNNQYTVVNIGAQQWTVENLKTTKYSNGVAITYLTSDASWTAGNSGYCEYDNSIGKYKNKYGYLYNWYAVDNSNGLAYFTKDGSKQTGWVVPSAEDYITLSNFANSNEVSVGYTQTYGGFRNQIGAFYNMGIGGGGWWWTSTPQPGGGAKWQEYLPYDSNRLQQYHDVPVWGYSIRCMRDTDSSIILRFTTESSTSFNANTSTTSGILKWNLGDASYNIRSNIFYHLYSWLPNLTTQYIKVMQGTTDGSSSITRLSLVSNNISNTMDVSSLKNLNFLEVQNNLKLTRLVLPNSSTAWNTFTASDSDLSGTLDVSGLIGLGGTFNITNNPHLNYILNPVSSKVFSQYSVAVCGLIGSLDVSGLSGLGGDLQFYSNPSLNKILWPTSNALVSKIYLQGSDLTGKLDLRGFSRLGGDLFLTCNGNLTSINNPSSSENITGYYVFENKLLTLDVSKFSRLGGTFWFAQNSSLNSIIHGPSNELITLYRGYSCDISILDVSCLTRLGGEFDINGNKKLTKITNPVSAEVFTNYYVFDCSLNGTLDVSGLSKLGGLFLGYNNINLQNILLPNISTNFTIFDVNNCSLNQTTVNNIFSKFNTYYSVSTNIISNITIKTDGGRNMSPTNGSTNADIVHLKTLFTQKGWNASIGIN